MVCSWTGTYLYNPYTPQNQKSALDCFCDKICDYVNCESETSKIVIEKDNSWSRHGQQIELDTIKVRYDNSVIAIEELAEEMYTDYDAYLNDEASDFGRNPYYIGKPWMEDDIEIFVYDNMRERGM